VEQQEECKYRSDLTQHLTKCSDFALNQVVNHVGVHILSHLEQEVEDDCLSNFVIKADYSQISSNFVKQSSYEHFYEEEIVICDDQKFFLKDQGGSLFSRKREDILKQSRVLNQFDCDLGFEDPVAALLESYLLDSFQFSDFIILLAFVNKYDPLKEFLWLLSHFYYYLFISGRRRILLDMKLLTWLHWKHEFT